MNDDRPTRAVVVDDSQFMRTVISDILDTGGIDVVGEARHGRAALSAVETYEPDVVTMDVEMPEMDGLEAVDRIMAEQPTPILMLSAHTGEDADVTFDALDRGAVDFFTKPGGEVSMEMVQFEDQLVTKVESVARSDVSTTGVAEGDGATTSTPTRTLEEPATIVIGSSTGGPRVVETVLAQLPSRSDLRIIVVQHMPKGFTGRFADRLDSTTDLTVTEAAEGDSIGPNQVAIAQGGAHLLIAADRNGVLDLELSEEPPVNGVRPAIDITMQSAANTIDEGLIGVVLTGMGRDGAAGVEAIDAAGGAVVVQDEATSAVFGMPKRAIETGVVDAVLPVNDLANGILETVIDQ